MPTDGYILIISMPELNFVSLHPRYLPDQVLESVGYLAGVPGFEKREVSETLETEEKLPEITEPMLVMRDFTGRRIDTLLLNLRKAKVPKINLKAIVTEQNAGWSFYHLYEEIGEEHRLMNGGAQ